MIGVVLGFQVDEQRRESESAQCGGREDRALQTVRGPLAEDSPVLIDMGPLRIAVRRGFDPEVLRTILAVVTEAR